MEKYRMIIILIGFLLYIVSCLPRKEKSEHIKIYSRKTGEAVAVDHLIQKYELQHQKFYQEVLGDNIIKIISIGVSGTCLIWPHLDNKNLSEYCRNYLQHTVPTRTTNNVIGSQFRGTLHYDKENTTNTSEIVIVRCKFKYKSHRMIYYMTRAPEPNCVYALKSTGNWSAFIFTIIHKYCNFENNAFNETLKRKRKEFIGTIHRRTGQPIAKSEYLLEYELEHQMLVEGEGNKRKYVEWKHITSNNNLHSYCYQYLKQCVPSRSRDAVRGKWRTEKLHYMKLNRKEDIFIVVLTCQQGNMGKVNYLLTRALEANCVYALLYQNRLKSEPFVIIFKHCDFEVKNVQKINPQNYDTVFSHLIPKSEVKEESVDILETLQLYPQEDLADEIKT